MIIDSHMHIAESIKGLTSKGSLTGIGNGMAIYDNGEVIDMFPSTLGDFSFTPENLIELMDKYNVEKGILLQGNYLGVQNYYTYKAVKKYPNRFKGAFSFDPYIKNRLEIMNYYYNLGFDIMKFELSNSSGYSINRDYSFFDQEFIEIFEFAKTNKIKVVLDIGRPRNSCYKIDELEKITEIYKDIKFIICHLTAPQFDDFELLKINLKKLNKNNVFFDVASLHNNTKPEVYPFNKALSYIRYSIDYLGINKLMFGSDVPQACTKLDYELMIKYISDSNLFNEEELNHLFYQNALEVYFK